MLTSTAITICESLADKYGSAIVATTDWTNYLNMAQWEVLNQLIPDSLGDGTLNIETDYNTLEEVRPLVYTVSLTPTAGLVTNSQLATALQTASGDNTCGVFRLLNCNITNVPGIVRFVKYNNISAYTINVFKTPATAYPIFTLVAAGYQFYPTTALGVTLTVLKTPKQLTNTGETIDFSDYVCNQIIFLTLKLAGVQIRDTDIAFDLRNTGITSAA